MSQSKIFLVRLLGSALLLGAQFASAQSQPVESKSVLIGNFLRHAPCGIAWVVNDEAGFVLDTGGVYNAGTAAADDSYHRYTVTPKVAKDSKATVGAKIVLEWGRKGNTVLGRITSDAETNLKLTLSAGWPGWESAFTGTQEGATGVAQTGGKTIHWEIKMSPAPTSTSTSDINVTISPNAPVRFVAGIDTLPSVDSVDATLENAAQKLAAGRPQASGDWGDFIGAIADNMNNSRLYSSDNHLLAHSVSRTWSNNPNGHPYFCWDSFFNANLAAINDPEIARNTVRGILSCQTREGLVPNFGHWHKGDASGDRSQPPVGSWCVWKMHQRYLDDLEFLKEVYPKLVVWHDWWPKYRNAKGDGLLQWGSNYAQFQGAQYETGWDDNLTYRPALMVKNTMNCYSVDLSAMWAMDAHYLAMIADALGKTEDAQRFRREKAEMNQRINDKLWNPVMKVYCSRFWEDATGLYPVPQSAFGSGFDGEYFKDEKFQTSAGTTHVDTLASRLQGHSPLDGIDAKRWSVRWKSEFTAPETATYRFTAMADHSARLFLDGKEAFYSDLHNLYLYGGSSTDVSLQKGQKLPIGIEFVQYKAGADMRLSVEHLRPAHGDFLPRLSPMNFYPLSAGAPDAERAKTVLSLLTDPKKFWGYYLLPTVAYDDPEWFQQHYWKGKVWAPVNYIVFEGIKRYASPEQISEFGERNVGLFMTNWDRSGACGENYLSTDGTNSSDAHYTWGALLCLVGLESIVDVDDLGQIVLNGAQTKTISLKNIPLLGQRYDVRTQPGSAVLIHNGKVVLEAKGKMVSLRQ